MARPVREPLRRTTNRRQDSTWREGGTGGDSRVQPSRFNFPTGWRVGRQTSWASQGWPRASPGWPIAVPKAFAARGRLLQQVVDWAGESDDWHIAGRWDPETHVGALSLIVPNRSTPQDLGGILDASFEIAVRPGFIAHLHSSALGTFPTALSA